MKTYAFLLTVFIGVEAAYHAVGIQFDASPLDSSWQYLDPQLLHHDLLRSLWYLHSQPPAFNFLIGLVLKVSGSHWAAVLHTAYVVCGLCLYLGTFVLMRQLGVNAFLASAGATTLLISPSFVLYEHWLFYPFPLATALVLSAVLLGRFLVRPSPWLAFCLSLALLFPCASLSVYQLPYFMLIVGSVAATDPTGRRALLRGAAAPFVLLLVIQFKNAVTFGVPTTSSWGGMSLSKMTVGYLGPATVNTLVAAGTLSPMALIEPFSSPEVYPTQFFSADGVAGIPALSARVKSNGEINLNHIGYLRLSAIYLQDSLAVLRRHPRTFVAACADAWRIYFWSSSAVRFLDVNKAHIDGWNRAFDRVVYGQWRDNGVCTVLVLGLLLAVAVPIARLASGQGASLRESVLLAFVVFNIGYLAVIGNTLEVGENNRFRFASDALSMTMVLVGIQWTLDRFRRRDEDRPLTA